MVTNPRTGTTVDEIAEGIYRISTPSTVIPGGFTFNQYLVVDRRSPACTAVRGAATARHCCAPSPTRWSPEGRR